METSQNEYLAAVEKALLSYFPEPSEGQLNGELIRSIRYSLLNAGKRIRPLLVLAFCEICGGNWKDAVSYACAVEMIHTYSLIHDDLPCMDNDDLRRGKPTNHKVFGEDMALLAGDGLLTMAFQALLSAPLDAEANVAAGKVLAACAGASGMVGGQCIDIQCDGKDVDLPVLQAMDEGKTVALISAACQLGCIAAHGDEKQISCAKTYADCIGMAFQIRDDILDVLGNVEELGKNTGMDSSNEKRNYVSLLGVDKAQQLVEEYTEKSLSALEHFPGNPDYLSQLAKSMAVRMK
jgi:geranylgeranyl diphosphate synthase type II